MEVDNDSCPELHSACQHKPSETSAVSVAAKPSASKLFFSWILLTCFRLHEEQCVPNGSSRERSGHVPSACTIHRFHLWMMD